MRILMVRANQGYPDSRVEKEIYSLSKENDVELLGWDRTCDQKNISNRNVKINDKVFNYHLFCISAPQGGGFKKTLLPMLKFWNRVSAYLKKYQDKYDVIHFCDFDTAGMAFSFVNRKKTKIVYDIFDYYADSHNAPKAISSLIKKRENYIINHSNAVILCSEKRKEQITPASNKNTVIIHNAPSQDIKLKKIHIQGNENSLPKAKLVYVGMLSNDRYLKDIGNVIIHHPEVEWHVGGFGVLSSYFEQLAQDYPNIFFYGKLAYSETLYLESKCDIMTAIYDPNVPNHKYAAPNKFYESLMLEKSVIMMKNTGMDQIVDKYSLGRVIDLNNGDFQSLFEKALLKLSQEKERNSKRKQEKCIYEKYFSWNIMEKRLLKAYEAL